MTDYATEAEAQAAADALNELDARQTALEIRKLELEIRLAERNESRVLADTEHRGHFRYIGEVREGQVHLLIDKLEEWSEKHPGSPCEILVNSGGGTCVDGFALVDCIRRLRKRGHHVTTVGTGIVASMAGIILQAGETRCMTEHAWMGVHEVSSVNAGSVTLQEDALKFAKKLQDQAVALLTERSTLTPTRLKNMWKRQDVYLSAAEALKLGLIDRIEE